MIVITRNAQLTSADAVERMLDDIACPACGYQDPVAVYRLTPGNKVRFFCDGCGPRGRVADRRSGVKARAAARAQRPRGERRLRIGRRRVPLVP